jgi:hypothetical protein
MQRTRFESLICLVTAARVKDFPGRMVEKHIGRLCSELMHLATVINPMDPGSAWILGLVLCI